MQGQLFTIIYDFFYNIFTPSHQLSYGQMQRSFYGALAQSGNFYDNLFNYVNNNLVQINESNLFSALLAFIFTYIVMIFLFICLIKLFKRIFNLIFRLFRLN